MCPHRPDQGQSGCRAKIHLGVGVMYKDKPGPAADPAYRFNVVEFQNRVYVPLLPVFVYPKRDRIFNEK